MFLHCPNPVPALLTMQLEHWHLNVENQGHFVQQLSCAVVIYDPTCKLEKMCSQANI